MLIHKMRLDDNMAVLDVNSGAVHLVDDVIYDLLDFYKGDNDEEAVAALKDRYSEEDLRDALAEMHELQENGLLFSPGFDVPPTFAEKPIVKSLCLLVTHDCNLRCGYCFADTGSFGGCRQLMSKETAEKAVEFAIEGSMKRHNLELDLFGGEPLMNWPVVVHIVEYVRRREKETGKNIKLTLTTNGTLLNDENIKFLNDNRVMLVLSLDGKKETHDAMRPFPNKSGSYDAAVRGFKKVIDSREGKNYYLKWSFHNHLLLAFLLISSPIETTSPFVSHLDEIHILFYPKNTLSNLHLVSIVYPENLVLYTELLFHTECLLQIPDDVRIDFQLIQHRLLLMHISYLPQNNFLHQKVKSKSYKTHDNDIPHSFLVHHSNETI